MPIKKHSETHFCKFSDYDEFANKIPFVGDILQAFQFASYFSFQPVLHDWCNKWMLHIKKTLLLIGKSSPCGGSGFPFSLSEWSFTYV